MVKGLKIVSNDLLADYEEKIDFDTFERLSLKAKEILPFDYFRFYNSVSSVYSSKIEGEDVDVDSYIKHKFLNVKYEPDYTKKADDLTEAYEFMEKSGLDEKNVLRAHSILSQNLLAPGQRGMLRKNPMFVLNEEDRIEYVACDPGKIEKEWGKLFHDIEILLDEEMSINEVFYYAAYIHLVFLKIHPLQDGNGRTARLVEKWFLREKIGREATSIELEKNYFKNKQAYYNNIRKIGLEYETLDYSRSLDLLLMTINSLKRKDRD